jgi:catechol 2,3-dioxygenase-like lactoylglutathione lyase family enzyme
MLQVAKDFEVTHSPNTWNAYFWVSDAQSLFQEFKNKGAIVAYEPEYMELYGNLEFAIKDPDGYLIAFGQDMEAAPPSTKISHISPVLASSDVPRDIQWYTQKLGFSNVYDSTNYQEGPADYVVLKKQQIFIHMQYQFPKDMTSTDLKFVVKDITPLFEEYIEAGVVSKEAMRYQTPWSTNEFSFFDLSGNRLTFLEDI